MKRISMPENATRGEQETNQPAIKRMTLDRVTLLTLRTRSGLRAGPGDVSNGKCSGTVQD